MSQRHLVSVAALAILTIVGSLGMKPLSGQTPPRGTVQARAGTGAAPRTPWGDPDLQGVWTNSTTTPFERPAALAGKASLTEAERAELDAQAARSADGRPRAGDPGTYNDFWFDRGKRTTQTSLITNPADGKLPPLTPRGKQLQETIARARQSPPTSPEDLSLFERCMSRSMPGAMIPGFYNHNYQIVQTPGYVVLMVEMIHDVRIIPTDGRPHVPPGIRKWLGDSRGRWEGNTLVVETTNVVAGQELRPSRTVMGGTEQLTLVERFTRMDADTIDYQFTVTDPEMFTGPWTAATPMTRIQDQIFEYACHEGNHAIVNMLKGARLEEREAGGGAKR